MWQGTEELDLTKRVVVVSVGLWDGRMGEEEREKGEQGKSRRIRGFCGERVVLMTRVKWIFHMRC